ncbi:ATP-dependent RNA helicase RhlE [Cytospora mali]|uniref:ATP-dependent RNA helicase RhlE n=1 Tax=Cytospora mali TaxID=578113 RepID=A0A194VC25_CYTMA|nr:ATP-dependent RNA helicase RhlE [Valsa mali var. pyri (nom. inval.)]
MSRLLPARYFAGSGSQPGTRCVFARSRPSLAPLPSLPRQFSTSPTVQRQNGVQRLPRLGPARSDLETVFTQPEEDRILNQIPPYASNSPDARSEYPPRVGTHEDNQADNPLQWGTQGTTSNDEDTESSYGFHLPRPRMSRPSPLGTLPRDDTVRTQDPTPQEPPYLRTPLGYSLEWSYTRNEMGRPKNVADATPSLKSLPLHPDLLQTVVGIPELNDPPPVETEIFRCINSGKSVFIHQLPSCTPAHILPVIHKVLSSVPPGSTMAGHAALVRHIAKSRPISALILSPWPHAAPETSSLARELLRNFPDHQVASAFPGKSIHKIHLRLMKGCDVLVADPRTLATVLNSVTTQGSVLDKLGNLQTIVVENAGALKKSMVQIQRIFSQLPQMAAQDAQLQRVLVSARRDATGPVAELVDVLLPQEHEYINVGRYGQTEEPPRETKQRSQIASKGSSSHTHRQVKHQKQQDGRRPPQLSRHRDRSRLQQDKFDRTNSSF